MANIEANHGQGDRRTACVEGTTSDGSSAQRWEPEVRPDSAPEDPPALPFSLKPVLDLDALEQVVKQEEDDVSMSCDLDVAEEGRQDGLGDENAFGPPSVQAHPLNNAELPSSTPSAVHAKSVQKKRRISCDYVANDAKATRRSEHFHGSTLDEAEASAAPASITESDYDPGTSAPKRIRAATEHPPQHDSNENGASSPHAPKGAACQKTAHAQPSSKEDEETPTLPSGGGSTKTWQCPSCSKVFSYRSSLYRHRRLVHERLRPLKCPHCAKSFGLKHTLQYHIRALHTRERPFACPHCPRWLSTAQYLRRHRLTHVDDRPHHCEVCGKRYQELRGLQNHVLSKHPTEFSFD
ncbi:hypothetical protein MTO96_004990 [Rhipicephalus appendiculatus]